MEPEGTGLQLAFLQVLAQELKYRNTTLVYLLINKTDIFKDNWIYVQDSEAGTDDVIVKVGLKAEQDFDVVKELKDRFRSRLRVAPKVEILPADEIQKINFPAKSRKPVKFIDLRKK